MRMLSFVFVAAMLLVPGTGALAQSPQNERDTSVKNPIKETRRRMEIIWKGLVKYNRENQRFPTCGFAELISGNELMFHLGYSQRQECRTDAWGREFFYDGGDGQHILLVSGGENGIVDTTEFNGISEEKDDLVLYGTLQDINIMEPKSRPAASGAAVEAAPRRREANAWATGAIPEVLQSYLEGIQAFIDDMDNASRPSDAASAYRRLNASLVALADGFRSLKRKYPGLSGSEIPSELRPFKEQLDRLMPRFLSAVQKGMRFQNDPEVRKAIQEMQEGMRSLQ